VADMIFDALFGWILDLLPFDISVARRRRFYRNGQRVYFRARVSGVPGCSTRDFLAAEQGNLWLARRRGDPVAEMIPIPRPVDPNDVTISDKPTWSQDRYLAYTINGSLVKISCNYDWDLLREAFEGGAT
jgi:hypothetical protein